MAKNFFLFFSIIIVSLALVKCNNAATDTAPSIVPAAEKQLRDAITEHPDSFALTENLIKYFSDNSNFGQAIAEADKAIQKDTSNAKLWDIKSILYFLNKDTMNAIKSLERAIRIDPQPSYKISLGLTYAQVKNPKAIEMADELLTDTQAKASKQAAFIKGFYYSYMDDYQKSISFFDTCLAIDYTYIDAYKEKAICLYNLGKYTDAIESLKKATALQSSYDEGYYWLGRCYQKLNQQDDAIKNYEMALQIDPDYAEAKDALSKMK